MVCAEYALLLAIGADDCFGVNLTILRRFVSGGNIFKDKRGISSINRVFRAIVRTVESKSDGASMLDAPAVLLATGRKAFS